MMWFMVICDTSFLYAFFNEFDLHHKDAVKIGMEYENANLFTPVEVIEELLTTLTRRTSSDNAIKTVENIFKHDSIGVIHTNELVFDKSWETFKKLNPHKFSFVDCILISLIKDSDGVILTFDKELLKTLGQNQA